MYLLLLGFIACFISCFASALAAQHEPVATKTPIKHLVVIFQENRTFDHYFGTYPKARNLPGETPFVARSHTPSVNGFSRPLLVHNQNISRPFRLSPSQANTCSPGH